VRFQISIYKTTTKKKQIEIYIPFECLCFIYIYILAFQYNHYIYFRENFSVLLYQSVSFDKEQKKRIILLDICIMNTLSD